MRTLTRLALACAFLHVAAGCYGAGDGGEGEGEGEGEACDTSAFADEDGNGLVASDATLAADPDNSAGCGTCTFDPARLCETDDDCSDPISDPCLAPGTDAFLLSFTLSDTSVDRALGGNDVLWSEDGGAPQSCATFPAASQGVVVCPLCFASVPADLAAQFDDGVDRSNAICVDTSPP